MGVYVVTGGSGGIGGKTVEILRRAMRSSTWT